MNKDTLRKQFINLPTSLENEHVIIDNAVGIIEKFDPKIIGIYIAYEHEVDLSTLMLKCPGRRFAAPKIKRKEDDIFFVNYNFDTTLERHERYKTYLQPVSDTEIFPDLIFIPALAFDIKGNRLGRGRGHYDKYLNKFNIIKIGVTASSRLLKKLPTDIHDVKMNYILTENMILHVY